MSDQDVRASQHAASADEPARHAAASLQPSWVTLAILKRPQGRNGELLAELLTDFPDRFRQRPEVFLAPSGFAGEAAGARAITITNSWLPVGRNQGRVVLGFAGIDSISAAETLEGFEVIVPEEERVELANDEAYISDLAGCTVINADNGQPIGTVDDVEFPTTADGSRRLEAAAPLLVVCGDNAREILIPYVKSFVVEFSLAERRILMQLPEGLIDLNRDQVPK